MKSLIFTIIFSINVVPLCLAGENDLYDFMWLDPDKKVFVLQNKVHVKSKKIITHLGAIKNYSSNFQDSYGFHFDIGYFFNEEWGIEFLYQNYQNSKNDDYKNVRQISGLEPFVRTFNQQLGINFVWSPFYGKINTFNKIFYFDWKFATGFSSISADSNLESVRNPESENRMKKESLNGVMLKTGISLYFDEKWSLGIDYMNTSYRAKTPSSEDEVKLKNKSDVVLKLGFSF
jgi:outer membrane beta-barrel protein